MTLTIVTVAEPAPPPVRIGAPWRRHHGPNEDADEYIRHLGARWVREAPGLETSVVYDPISAADGMRDFLAAHPAGLIAVTSHLRRWVPTPGARLGGGRHHPQLDGAGPRRAGTTGGGMTVDGAS